MSGRILCGVDDSPHAARAIDVAIELASGLGRDLVFVAVNKRSSASGFPPIRTWSDAEVEKLLSDASHKAREQGVRNPLRVAADARDVAGAIIDCAAGQGADHIVVGSGKASLAGRLLLGSVSEAVVRLAPCTVTVAR